MFIIRRARIADLTEAARLFNEYRVFYKKESNIAAAVLFLRERLIQNESVIFLAFNNEEKAVGFMQLYPLFSSTRMKRLWLLNDLFVDYKMRGKGISLELIQHAKTLAIESDACGVILETGKDNEIGNVLYPRAGFTLEQHQNYYEWAVETA